MKKVEKKIELAGRTLTLTTGRLAEQADGAVLASYGETVVLATVVSKELEKELDYFPLTVDYQERLYAGGRIKGSKWVKREGRPTDEEILSGRLIDRSLRPLFPKTYKKEVQLIVTVLSGDFENDPSILATIAASAAISVSSVPWKGPVGVVRIEAGAKEVPEKQILEGIKFAQAESLKIISLIEDLTKEVGTKKEVFEEVKPPAKLVTQVKKLIDHKLESLVKGMATNEGGFMDFKDLVIAASENFEEEEKKFIPDIVNSLVKDFIREVTLKGKRADGRKHTEIRTFTSEVGVLPRTHGSAIFARGQTQVLTAATLGAPSLGQLLESAEGEEAKQYMHHYSMPPYATGETGRIGSPNRREIGHGALAERALIPVIPEEEIFPYAIRVVSEVMSSNGSTSMASVCGSTLSLMDAGVPLKAPVSGIAMGLIIEPLEKYAILSDIMGLEDFNGDMDFKVAGTSKGITALQLDVKTLKLTPQFWRKLLIKLRRDGILFSNLS